MTFYDEASKGAWSSRILGGMVGQMNETGKQERPRQRMPARALRVIHPP